MPGQVHPAVAEGVAKRVAVPNSSSAMSFIPQWCYRLCCLLTWKHGRPVFVQSSGWKVNLNIMYLSRPQDIMFSHIFYHLTQGQVLSFVSCFFCFGCLWDVVLTWCSSFAAPRAPPRHRCRPFAWDEPGVVRLVHISGLRVCQVCFYLSYFILFPIAIGFARLHCFET